MAEKGVELKKDPRFLKTEEIEAALAEREARDQAELDALAEKLDEAYVEAEKILVIASQASSLRPKAKAQKHGIVKTLPH